MAPSASSNPGDLSPEELAKAVETFREKFLQDMDEKDGYMEADVQKLREDNNLCERFILQQQGNVNKALDMAKESFKWRKEFGVQGIKESGLSLELLKDGAAHPYNHDIEGNPILMFVVKLHKKDAEKTEDQRRYIVYWVEKLLKESSNCKVTILYDCIGSGYSNMDLEMTMFITHLFIKYYPSSLGYLIVYDMPWLFNAIWKVIKPLLPKNSRDKVKFCNKETIKELIEPKCLPLRMGGEDSKEWVYEPVEEAK